MNQEYRGRVKRHLESGGDPKYVNVKGKAKARHEEYAKKMTTAAMRYKAKELDVARKDPKWAKEKPF